MERGGGNTSSMMTGRQVTGEQLHPMRERTPKGIVYMGRGGEGKGLYVLLKRFETGPMRGVWGGGGLYVLDQSLSNVHKALKKCLHLSRAFSVWFN